MKTKDELNKEIFKTLVKIGENHPELLNFQNETTITIPSEKKLEMSANILNEYNDSHRELPTKHTKQSVKNIVIIGAGFAGLKLARTLNNHPNYTITLLDKNNFHQFQPLLYQVALANLDASNISFPLRNIFHGSKNVTIRVASVTNINTEINTIETSIGKFNYDYLVIATGAVTNFFGNSSIEQYCLPMKSTWEALLIRNTLLTHFEDAITASNSNSKKLLSVIIVGGGPTGVELSGALAEMKTETLPIEYPELNFAEMKIFLLEGSTRLLSSMSEASSLKAKEYLEKLGVTVLLNTLVKEYDGSQVLLKDASVIESSFVIWAILQQNGYY